MLSLYAYLVTQILHDDWCKYFIFRPRLIRPTNNRLIIIAIWELCQISAWERWHRAVKFREEVEVCSVLTKWFKKWTLDRVLITFPHPSLHLSAICIWPFMHTHAENKNDKRNNVARIWWLLSDINPVRANGPLRRIRVLVKALKASKH